MLREEARMTVMAAAKRAGVEDLLVFQTGTRTEEGGLRFRQIRSVTAGKADKVLFHRTVGTFTASSSLTFGFRAVLLPATSR